MSDRTTRRRKPVGLAVAISGDGGRTYLHVNPERDFNIVKGLASQVRIRILKVLRRRGPLNVNEISEALELPQSTIATNIQVLEEGQLVHTHVSKGRKGQQKICVARFDEIIIALDAEPARRKKNVIEVEMPLGLYTSCKVSAPCGLCSTEGVIGALDVPDLFLDPARVKTALLWFGRGFVEYQFPNNAKALKAELEALEFVLELSSEVPGTNANWPSDITLWVNEIKIGTWTSPGDFGDRRGRHTPRWWKLEGSQYGDLTTWRIDERGTFQSNVKMSSVTLAQLRTSEHHSIRLRVGIDERARHPGGVNIFGKGFGNHSHDILMRQHVKEHKT
jgi:predicted transcriptional regulator